MPSSTRTIERRPAGTSAAQVRPGSVAPRRRRAAPAESRRRPRNRDERLARELPSHAAASQPADATPPREHTATPHGLGVYVPLALLATASVLLAPALIVGLLLHPRGLPAQAGCALLAALLSIAIARLEAYAWQRRRGTADLLYGDLMLWGLARRWWLERRLRLMRVSYATAAATSRGRIQLLEGLNRLLESRSAFTHRHCRRVARYAEQIARALHLSPAEIARVRSAALVHDVGKVYTPLAILHKPGPLTDQEFEIVKRHASDGADMLGPVHDPQLARIVRHHHERVDGSGYPDGLAGEQIPFGARIIAVADTFDAVTSQRPYRAARSHHEGLDILVAESGRQLDARAVEAFRENYSARRSVASLAILTAFLDRLGSALLPFGLGGSAAQLLPALGAAGVLALSPSLRAEKPVQREPPALSGALSAPFGGALGAAAASPVGGGQPSQTTAASGGSGTAPHGGVHAPRLIGRGGGGTHSPTPAAAGTSVTAAPSAPGAPVVEVHSPAGSVKVKVPGQPVSGPIGETPAGTLPVHTPPLSTPPLSTPPVSTPPVRTPPVKTPPVEVPAVHVGPVSTPPVEVPAVHVPTVEVPPVRLPGLP